jgi:hypothetical protein
MNMTTGPSAVLPANKTHTLRSDLTTVSESLQKILKWARLLQMRNKMKERFLPVTFYVTIHVTWQGKILCIQQTFPTVPNYSETLTLRPPRTSTTVSVKRKISQHGLAHVDSIVIDSPTLHLCLTSCRIFVNLDQRLTFLL